MKRFNTVQHIYKFDKVTKFRLLNAFIFAIGFNLFVPILLDLKGEYLAAWAISAFMIGEQLAVKTNRYMVENFSISELYKMGIAIHIVFIISALTYFINPLYMVIIDGFITIIVMAVFGAESIKLNNYLTDNYPDMMSEFQIIRNNIWADALLIGLFITTVITYFFSINVGLICFIIYNSCYTIWMIINWNFYDFLNGNNNDK